MEDTHVPRIVEPQAATTDQGTLPDAAEAIGNSSVTVSQPEVEANTTVVAQTDAPFQQEQDVVIPTIAPQVGDQLPQGGQKEPEQVQTVPTQAAVTDILEAEHAPTLQHGKAPLVEDQLPQGQVQTVATQAAVTDIPGAEHAPTLQEHGASSTAQERVVASITQEHGEASIPQEHGEASIPVPQEAPASRTAPREVPPEVHAAIYAANFQQYISSQASAGPSSSSGNPYHGNTYTYDPTADIAAQAVTWTGPEADSQSDDTDSALGSYASTRSTSLENTAYDYRTFHGRRYHAHSRDGTEYPLPNDEVEMDRLDLQHHLFLMTLNGSLHKAPLKPDIQSALDIGTGTGIWAIDFADQYPSCVVTGTDLSPIQPAYVPPNCRFYVEDAEGATGWSFEDQVDYIHGRMLVVGIKNWAQFFQRAYDNLKPGGWIEMQDLNFPARCDDHTAPPDSPLMAWSSYMMQGAARFGIDLESSNQFPQLLASCGFTNIQYETYGWPINRWPRDKRMKEMASWIQQNYLQGLQAFSMAYFTRGLQWKPEELEVFLMEVRKQAKDRNSHIYMPISFFWAQKPYDA
jgi:cyclopropane fatty-acyl-phospholipid synthase-like methyltransferase